MKKCNITKRIEIVLTVMIAIFAVITVLRSFYTIDIADESFIVAETLLMLKGNIPYAINATDVSGMCFLILPFVFIYKLLVPSLAGIVLYLRLCFSVLRLIVVFLVYKIIRRKNKKIPSLSVALLLTVWYYFTNYFSYNSNAIWLLILVSVWVYDLHAESPCKKVYFQIFVAGILSAFAVFAHPFSAVPVALFACLLLLFTEKGLKIKYAGSYCAGGLFVAFSVLAIIVIKTSFMNLYNGLRILSIVVKQSESFSKIVVWKNYMIRYGLFFAVLILGFVVGFICAKKRGLENKVDFAAILSMAIGTFYTLLYFLITGFNLRLLGCYLGSMGILLSLILGLAKKEKMFLFTSLPFLLFVVLELSGQRNAAEVLHPSLAFPTLIAVVLVTFKGANRTARWIQCTAVIIMATQLLYADMIFTYFDDPISTLNSRVESGVYKGLISSEEKAKCLPQMETWIDMETEDCDSVLFRDNIPFAYLMYKGHTPELQSWDILNYSARWKKNAKIMYNNFKNRGEYPKKIIYIDYGYDDCLSIETDYEFNDWVNAYYDFVKEEQLNEMFRIKVYDYNGTFDGDYSKWTNF